MMRHFPFLILFLGFSAGLMAQNPDETLSTMIENIVEQIASEDDSEIDLTSLVEDLYYFAENPINLNNATKSQLQKLHFLTDYQMGKLITYTDLNGQFLSIYELKLVDGFDAETIQKLLPFITLKEVVKAPKLRMRNAIKYGRHQFLLRYQNVLEPQQGYLPITDSLLELKPNSRYLGRSEKLYARYNYRYSNKLKFGVTGEKDAGEEFFSGTQPQGFDFSSFHFQIKNSGILKQVNLGDFHARFGQGLVMWSGYSFGKSIDNLFAVERTGQGLNTYSSVDEFNFLRGGGIMLGYGNVGLSIYASSKMIDGTVVETDTLQEEEYIISSLQTTGIHATASEMEKRHSIRENIIGANLNLSLKNIYIGLNYVREFYDTEIVRDTRLYNQFYFQGKELSNLSLDYRFRFLNVNVFGETAINDAGTIATVNGLKFRLSSYANLILVNRYYEKEYYAVKANAFGEKQSVSNESGTFLGLELSPLAHWKISAWIDTYHFPWLRFGINAPSDGYAYVTKLSYYQSHVLQMYARLKYEKSQKTATYDLTEVSKLSDVTQMSVRWNMVYSVSDNLRFKNRVEWSAYEKEENRDNGWLVYQDVKYSFEQLPLTLSGRFAMFNTTSWDTRIYAWEDDVLYSFSVPAMYSKGIRGYLVVRWKINSYINVWGRIAQTSYSDKDVIGTGLNQIDGSNKTEVKLMMRVKF